LLFYSCSFPVSSMTGSSASSSEVSSDGMSESGAAGALSGTDSSCVSTTGAFSSRLEGAVDDWLLR